MANFIGLWVFHFSYFSRVSVSLCNHPFDYSANVDNPRELLHGHNQEIVFIVRNRLYFAIDFESLTGSFEVLSPNSPHVVLLYICTAFSKQNKPGNQRRPAMVVFTRPHRTLFLLFQLLCLSFHSVFLLHFYLFSLYFA